MPLDDRSRLHHLYRRHRRDHCGQRRRRHAKHHRKYERDRSRSIRWMKRKEKNTRKIYNRTTISLTIGIRFNFVRPAKLSQWKIERVIKNSSLFLPFRTELTYFSLSGHRLSPCLGAFSRISGHFVIAPPPSPSTSSSVFPLPLLLFLHRRCLLFLLLPPPPPPRPPLPPPASPPSTSGGDSSRCCPLLLFPLSPFFSLRFFSSGPARSNHHRHQQHTRSRCNAASGGVVTRVD